MNDTISKRDTTLARKAMIDSQLRTSGVNEEFALSRMLAVPREDFLPEDKKQLAYIDRSIALGSDSYLASPLFFGKLLVEAAPLPADRVLIIEGGTNYLAKLITPLVTSVDVVSSADAANGLYPEGAFSLVLVDGAIEQVPNALTDKVEEGGKIVTGLLLRQVTRLASGRKIAGQVAVEPIEDLGIPVITSFNKPKAWTFS